MYMEFKLLISNGLERGLAAVLKSKWSAVKYPRVAIAAVAKTMVPNIMADAMVVSGATPAAPSSTPVITTVVVGASKPTRCAKVTPFSLKFVTRGV